MGLRPKVLFYLVLVAAGDQHQRTEACGDAAPDMMAEVARLQEVCTIVSRAGGVLYNPDNLIYLPT
jgi:hypothetical protein